MKLPNFLQRSLAPPPSEKPKHVTVNVKYNTPEYFKRTKDRNEADIERNQRIFSQGGLVTTALNRYPEYMFMNLIDGDLELAGDNQSHVDTVYNALEKYDFLTSAFLQVQNSLVCGDGIAAIVPSRSKRFHSTKNRDPKYFDAQVDQFGDIQKYLQITSTSAFPKQRTPVNVEDIWHIRLLPRTDSPWGNSLISTAIDEILRDTKTAEGIANGIERHGTPKLDVSVGTDDQEVNDDDLRAVAAILKELNSGTEIIHRGDVKLNGLDTSSFAVGDYSDTSLIRLFGALGVPADLVIKEGSSLATSDKTPKMKAFENTIKSMQTRFNVQTDHQLFRRIIQLETGEEPTSVRINFGDIDKDDWVSKADGLSKMMPQLDPYMTLHRNEIREILGLGKYEEHPDYEGDINE